MARILVLGGFAESLITFRGALLKEMVSNGHQVIACAPNASVEVKTELEDIGVSYWNIELNRAGTNPVSDSKLLIQLVGAFRKIKPDVFLGYTIKPVVYGSFAARLTGVRKIFSIITGLGYAFSDSGIGSRITGIIAERMYSFALRFNENVFFQNPDDMKLFNDEGIIKGERKSVLINGSGVDLAKYSKTPIPPDLSFLLIARLMKNKGIYEYVEAAHLIRKQYPEVTFKLVGFIDKNPNGISEKDLRAWIDSGDIEYLGRLKDVRPAIANSSVYVLPSYREGTPRSVLEAMAMGRAIITTDVPGCRETVSQGQNGFLVPVKNVGALVNAMKHFIEKPGDIVRMGDLSRKLASDKYDVHKVNSVMLKTMHLV